MNTYQEKSRSKPLGISNTERPFLFSERDKHFSKESSIFEPWLSQFPWDTFFTMTTAKETSPYGVYAQMKRFYQRSTISMERFFYVVEKGKVGQRAHAHGLISFPPDDWLIGNGNDDKRYILWAQAFATLGRARFEKINSKKDVTNYCLKYLLKEPTFWDYYEQTKG